MTIICNFLHVLDHTAPSRTQHVRPSEFGKFSTSAMINEENIICPNYPIYQKYFILSSCSAQDINKLYIYINIAEVRSIPHVSGGGHLWGRGLLIPDQDWIKQETFDSSPDAQVSSCPPVPSILICPGSWVGFLTVPLWHYLLEIKFNRLIHCSI